MVVAALLLGVGVTWPTILHPSDSSSLSRFTEGHISAFGLMAQTAPWTPWTTLAAAPEGVDFRPLLWPAGLLARGLGAVATYNVVLMLTPAFNVLGGWVLGRALGLARGQAAALGASLAFPPWVRTTLENGQPEQALLGSGALLLATVVWSCHGRYWRLGLVPLATFGLGVATPHVVLAGLVLVCGFSAFSIVSSLRSAARSSGPGVATTAVVPANEGRNVPPTEPRALAVSPIPAGRTLVAVSLALVGAWAVAGYHAPGFDPSIPHFFAPFGLLDASQGPTPKRAIQALDLVWRAGVPPGKPPFVLHLGYVGVPLMVAGLVGARRAPWAATAGVACLVLAVGEQGPYGLFASLSPTLSASGTPYRFVLGAVLAAAILAACTRAAWPLAALSLAESAFIDPRPLPFAPASLPEDASSAQIASRDGIVLDLPPPGTCRHVAGHYLVEATRHGNAVPLSLRSGALAYPHRPEFSSQLERALNAPDCAAQLAPLVKGFDVVVAHQHERCLLRETQLGCIQAVLGRGHSTPGVSWWILGEE